MLPLLNGDLPVGMLDSGNARVVHDCIGPGHVPYGAKGSLEGSLQDDFVLDCSGSARGSCLG